MERRRVPDHEQLTEEQIAESSGTTLLALASTSSSTRRAFRTQPSCGALPSIFREADVALPSGNWSSIQLERVQAGEGRSRSSGIGRAAASASGREATVPADSDMPPFMPRRWDSELTETGRLFRAKLRQLRELERVHGIALSSRRQLLARERACSSEMSVGE